MVYKSWFFILGKWLSYKNSKLILTNIHNIKIIGRGRCTLAFKTFRQRSCLPLIF